MKKFCVVIITIITTITNCCVGFASPFGDKLENGISMNLLTQSVEVKMLGM